MLYLEYRYYCDCEKGIYYLGKYGEPYTNNLEQNIEKYANNVNDYLGYNPHIQPDVGSKIDIFVQKDIINQLLIVNYWISARAIDFNSEYAGYFLPEDAKNKFQKYIIVPTHTWYSHVGAKFIKPKILMMNFLNEYFKVSNEKFQDSLYLRFMMYQDIEYTPVYVHAYFRERRNMMHHVETDTNLFYLAEITLPNNVGFYFHIKKSAVQNRNITSEDIIALD